MVKVCICFYGLVQRSLKYTIESIETNIINILKSNNIEYDIYLHTYNSNICHSIRSGENNISVNPDDYKLLNPYHFIIESYEKADNFINYKKYKDKTFNDNYNTMLNWIREMYSIKQVTTLWQDKKNEYDFFLYLRPDLIYVTTLPIVYIQKKLNMSYNKNILFTVPWGKSNGLNDFIGIGNYNAIVYWANRIYTFDEYMTTINYNAEKHIQFICEKYNINNIDLPMLFYRKRSTGKSVIPIEFKNNFYLKMIQDAECRINTDYL